MNELDVVLRPLEVADAADMLELQRRNRAYWRATAPPRDEGWFTLEAERRRLESEARERADGRGLFFGVFADGRLAGRVALSSIVRGAFLNAYLGYAVDEQHARRGVGTAAVGQAVALAWADGLHRVQAAVSPDNAASRRVLEKVGFRREGLAERYLLLAGGWTDQELWAITVEDRGPRTEDRGPRAAVPTAPDRAAGVSRGRPPGSRGATRPSRQTPPKEALP